MPIPKGQIAHVSTRGPYFLVECEYFDNARAKNLPEKKWDKRAKAWVAPATAVTAKAIKASYDDREMSIGAVDRITQLLEAEKKLLEDTGHFPPDHPFKGEPRPHQMEALNYAWGKRMFAFFHAMRSGKTYTIINHAAALWNGGEIEAAVIVVPSSIKPVWVNQFDQWSPYKVNVHMIESGKKRKYEAWLNSVDTKECMPVLVVGVEAMSQGNAYDQVLAFLKKHKCYMAVDESSRIKTYDAKRTQKVIDLGAEAEYRVIATGTPVTQGIHDLFAQFRFLHWSIIGIKTFTGFRNRYCLMGGFEGRNIIGYQNVPELMDMIRPYCHIVTKEEAMPNLPPKIMVTRTVKPTKAQLDLMDDLKDIMMAEVDGDVLTVSTVLERLTRYQQIAGGHFPFKNEEKEYDIKPLPGTNPKLQEIFNIADELGSDAKVVVWARFVPEILLIAEGLRQRFGYDRIVEYHGQRSLEQKEAAIRAFQEGEATWFVGNQRVGAMGIELSKADTMIYYSNSFSYEDREQSEERPIVKDKKESVLYIDLVLDHEVDKMIVDAQAKKKSMATYVTENIKGVASSEQ